MVPKSSPRQTEYGLGIVEKRALLFWYFVRAQYLFTQGFQLLADRNLLSEQWKQIRANAKNRTSELVEVLAKAPYGTVKVDTLRRG